MALGICQFLVNYHFTHLKVCFPLALAEGISLESNDCKSPQIFWTLSGILAVLNNAVVWVVPTRLLISKFSSPCTNPSLSLSCCIVFFQFSSKVEVLISLFAFLQFYRVISRNRKVHNSADSLSIFCWLSLVLVIWPRFDPFLSKNPKEFIIPRDFLNKS